MNILLDYLFPIATIEPTPAASTAFLKQVCVVVAPTAEAPNGVIQLKTLKAAVLALNLSSDATEEIYKLFDAGLSRVYVLGADDLDLETALEGHGSDFFTLLVSSDFSDEDVGQDITTPAVAASKVIGDLTFTAVKAGVLGNDITITLVDDADAGEEIARAVDKDITIHMEAGASTAQMIKDAVDDSVSASALVTVAIDSGHESDFQSDAIETNLEDGAHAVMTDGTGIQTGDFKGVVGVSSDDDDFLADQAAIANRSAFHTTSTNKAKNMFYAFGKLLSNALNWRNQQYVSMPLADDVSTLGAANALFDDKICFVISDSEFANKLSLFVAGGKAIVAPYIERNLQIDLQSKALQYISGNQPGYTKTQAALLEDELQKVIQSYIDAPRNWIEAGVISVDLLEDNFVASGNINIAEPKALWRIFGEMRASL